jgi:LacI family transcriptional regulator
MKVTPTVCILLPEVGIFREMILGFHSVAASAGWCLSFLPDNPDVKAVESAIKRGEVNGVLLGPAVFRRFLDEVGPLVPTVCAGVDLTDELIPSTQIDEAAIGRSAADHLLAQGHHHFAAFGFSDPFFIARAAAFQQQVRAAGGNYFGNWIGTRKKARSPGEVKMGNDDDLCKLVGDWVRSGPRPLAIFAGADHWGRLLNQLLKQGGIRVPDDVAVVGVDNEPLVCETASPPLSSVAVPWRQIGKEAGILMARCMASPAKRIRPAPLVLVQPSGVVVRHSSEFLAVNDENVAAALRIIRQRAAEPFSISDILKRVPIGRHALQRAFLKQVGHTMREELRRVRVERAKVLLASTDLALPAVAAQSGLSSGPRLSELFRREIGTTPARYRRTFRIS